ncbi:putative enoyl-CoA hydratase/isomerase [Rhizocola hellebori]|uniref:Putative enoyl-CoA hydratase/isomerase n=1 Tax=Rhizocola hellebori TaxID=1392758 RepID=A0A8J3Q2U9_9ACTN|nr:enoyl-CoA hydratase family protein [Rhizocola hellebori]GIH02346.1 putative enoyl-CoA hydratase/isomerase [Rhizocola hellebori]
MLVHLAVEAGIATITLDSPHNRNALSTQLMQELSAHLEQATADEGVRAIVLTHTGRVFCAGADLSQAGEGIEEGLGRLLNLLRSMVETPKPLVARIDGHVRAGGLGLVGACDLAIASPNATFAFTEARLGVAASVVSLTTLPRMSDRACARYLLTGEVFDSATAAAIGLITEAAADPEAALTALLDGIRACSPQGLAASKQLTTRAVRAALTSHGQEMIDLSARLFGTPEAMEGIMSFLQKRPPTWAAAP